MISKKQALQPTPLLLFVLAAATAWAHVGILPRESTAGATQKYTMRVPTEKTVPTVRIEAEFPAEVIVSSLEEKEGWKIEPKKDGAGKITGAVWSGGSIAPKDIGQFGFEARNPVAETKLVWKVVQIYEDGSKSEWTGPQGTRSPAPVTTIRPK